MLRSYIQFLLNVNFIFCGLVDKSRIKSLQVIDFNIFAKIITDMVKKMLFLWVCECGQERPERQETTI